MWDFGSAAFNAVLVTFIFSVYLVESVGATITGPFTASQYLSIGLGIAGVLIAAITPVMGQRADITGMRRRAVGTWTYLTVALMAALFLIRNDADIYFWLGIIGLALASITFEFAEVNYFAQLQQVSTPATVGRVSGFGWAMGYVGGIVLLLICYLGFIAGDGPTRGLLDIPVDGGLNVRFVAVFAALWFGVSAIFVLWKVPEISPSGEKLNGIGESYRRLFSDIAHLWRSDRNVIWFLLSSAIFRDGLAGIFTYGALLGVAVYGLAPGDVLLFGVAANVVSAAGAAIGGLADDRVGPKTVIGGSLISLIATGLALFFASGPTAFWVLGLVLCLFVGPAQASARSLLSRISPEGRDGQTFGLYATTGRAVSWLAPLGFFLAIWLGGGQDKFGILGIIAILAIGFLVLLPVRGPARG